MAWGAQNWVKITPEATYGTFDAGGTPVYIRLHADNAFTMTPTPRFKDIRSADGDNRPVQVVSSVKVFSGSLMTPLYPTQAAALLDWATTITTNALPSYTVDHNDGVRVRRYLGVGVNSLGLTCAADTDEGVVYANLSLTAQTLAGSDPTFAKPSFSSFPTENPYVHKMSSTGFSVGGATRTKYNMFKFNVANKLAATVDELAYISGLTYCGRDVTFSTSFQYSASTDQGNYEGQTALDCAIAFVHGTNTLTLDFNTKGRMSKRSRSLPLGDVSREEYEIRCIYDSGASGDFAFSVV